MKENTFVAVEQQDSQLGKKSDKTAMNIGVNFNRSCWLNLFWKHHCSRLLSVSRFTFVEFAILEGLI